MPRPQLRSGNQGSARRDHTQRDREGDDSHAARKDIYREEESKSESVSPEAALDIVPGILRKEARALIAPPPVAEAAAAAGPLCPVMRESGDEGQGGWGGSGFVRAGWSIYFFGIEPSESWLIFECLIGAYRPSYGRCILTWKMSVGPDSSWSAERKMD